MDNPVQQNAIRLVDFLVTSVVMDVENPFAAVKEQSMDVNVGVSIGFSDDDPAHYTINFEVSVSARNNNIRISVKSVALFEASSPIDEEFRQSAFVQTNSPAIAFPFLRSFINTLTANAGIPPVVLPAFNFSGKAGKQ